MLCEDLTSEKNKLSCEHKVTVLFVCFLLKFGGCNSGTVYHQHRSDGGGEGGGSGLVRNWKAHVKLHAPSPWTKRSILPPPPPQLLLLREPSADTYSPCSIKSVHIQRVQKTASFYWVGSPVIQYSLAVVVMLFASSWGSGVTHKLYNLSDHFFHTRSALSFFSVQL